MVSSIYTPKTPEAFYKSEICPSLEVFKNPKDQSQDQTGDFMKLKLKLRFKIPFEIEN
jgi:hypothetical protein